MNFLLPNLNLEPTQTHLFIQTSTNLQSSTPTISETPDNPKQYRCLNFHNENID